MVERLHLVAILLNAVANRFGAGLAQQSPLAGGNQCVLGDGRCSYHVNLLSGCSGVSNNDLSSMQGLPATEQTERLVEMERNLVVLRVDHARRITDLEGQLQKLLMNGGASSIASTQSEPGFGGAGMERKTAAADQEGDLRESRKSLPFKDEEDRGENLLLLQVHKEFSGLRRELLASRRLAKNLEMQLEEVRSKLNRSSVSLVRTTARLLETEMKLNQALADKEKTAAQLSETKKELALAKALIDDRTKELKNTTTHLHKTRKHNDQLQLKLDTCAADRDNLRLRLNESLELYNSLSKRYDNLSIEYERKESLLIECFRGKTSQFCGFEDPKICGFVQDKLNNGLNWVRWKDRTPSPHTGPSFDHTCGNNKGYYMYFNASSPGRGTQARMFSARYYGYAEQCVQFYYHMHGRYIGTLNVYTVVPGNKISPLWRAFGNQGDVWIMARLSIPAAVSALGYQVVFEGIVDRGYQGDIAIDDFQVLDGYC